MHKGTSSTEEKKGKIAHASNKANGEKPRGKSQFSSWQEKRRGKNIMLEPQKRTLKHCGGQTSRK